MKHMLGFLGLFLFFVGTLSGVKYLDAESAHYVTCVRHHNAVAQSPYLSENDRQNLIEKLEAPDSTFEVQGKTCPPLLQSHKSKLKTQLEHKAG